MCVEKHKRGRRSIVYDMTICNLVRGDRALALSVPNDTALRQRLRALGIQAGARFTVLKVTAFRGVYLLRTECATVAVGARLAAAVEVRRL